MRADIALPVVVRALVASHGPRQPLQSGAAELLQVVHQVSEHRLQEIALLLPFGEEELELLRDGDEDLVHDAVLDVALAPFQAVEVALEPDVAEAAASFVGDLLGRLEEEVALLEGIQVHDGHFLDDELGVSQAVEGLEVYHRTLHPDN